MLAGIVVPDGYGVLTTPNRPPLHLLLELDRGTEPSQILREKAKAYADILPHSSLAKHNPLVIFAVPSVRRAELRRLMLDTIDTDTGGCPGEDAERRRELTSQLERLRELYVMGDITKPQYVMRRQALEEELQRTKPPTNPDLDRAAAILEDFARFWDAEPEPAERRKLILSMFEQVWQKDGQIVAVKPNHAFASYFTAASEGRPTHPKPAGAARQQRRERRGSNPRPAPHRDPGARGGAKRWVDRCAADRL
ncbi:MAG TPA: replication-relaxation family protein [Solirubrobacteraceae bacterium]|jgi:hypothetical protein|nr:replication-relaxation family protein [Solirubrobacteraceae bacterium]